MPISDALSGISWDQSRCPISPSPHKPALVCGIIHPNAALLIVTRRCVLIGCSHKTVLSYFAWDEVRRRGSSGLRNCPTKMASPPTLTAHPGTKASGCARRSPSRGTSDQHGAMLASQPKPAKRRLSNRLRCGFACVYGQRNGKPSPPAIHVPDVQAMPLGVRYHPAALPMGAA